MIVPSHSERRFPTASIAQENRSVFFSFLVQPALNGLDEENEPGKTAQFLFSLWYVIHALLQF